MRSNHSDFPCGALDEYRVGLEAFLIMAQFADGCLALPVGFIQFAFCLLHLADAVALGKEHENHPDQAQHQQDSERKTVYDKPVTHNNKCIDIITPLVQQGIYLRVILLPSRHRWT